jgi:iron complex transport system permease protein
VVLGGASALVGASDLSLPALFRGDDDAAQLVWVSRVPRTLAVILAGSALAVAGLIMQLLARNRFVEPSTVGTTESAMLGLMVAILVIPGAGVLTKMAVASVFALLGTAVFLALIRRIPVRSSMLVPLVGIMLGGVVQAVVTFVAYENNLLQSLNAWMFGDFSGVLQGRYELLWIVAAVALAGYFAADRFTLAGLGEDFTTNLGVNYRLTLNIGLVIVSLITAVTVVTVGALPFLGLVVPNIVSLFIGDNLRRAVPWTAVLGAGLVLVCDLLARVIRYPFEVPVGLVMSVVGAAVFLSLILRGTASKGARA